MKLVTSAQMRMLEAGAEAAGTSSAQLMEAAGLATAQEAWMLLGSLEDRRISVLCGPGNNGGDGLVASRHLADWGVEVLVLLPRPRPDDPLVAALEERSVPVVALEGDRLSDEMVAALRGSDLIIDALLGTGRARPIEGGLAHLLDAVQSVRATSPAPKLLAVDLPSGLDADTGSVDPHTVPADETVTFELPKLGLHTQEREVAGRVQVVDIGIPRELQAGLPLELLDTAWVRSHLPRRPAHANKGTFGRVLSLTGSFQYVGAAYLATAAAARAGAGLLTFACARSLVPVLAGKFSEATFLPLAEENGCVGGDAGVVLKQELQHYDVLLAGCGLSQEPSVARVLEQVLFALGESPRGVVLDADALNILAKIDAWWQRLRPNCILTPHPGEMARLLGTTVADVQGRRLDAAHEAAERWRQIVVLKGAGTVIAVPDGRAWLASFANPALASAGTGDVLAGTIAAMLAQGLEAPEAACCGVFLHGTAGDLVRKEIGDAGALASDVLAALPRARQRILGLDAPLPALPLGGPGGAFQWPP